MGGPFMIDFIKTATGASDAMDITAGACVVGILLAAVAKPPTPMAA